VSASESDLTAAQKSWAYFLANLDPKLGDASSKAVEIAPQETNIEIMWDFKNANSDTAGISLYGYRDGGPAQFICSIDTITAGAQENGEETVRYFGDTIGTITQRWNGAGDAVTEVDSGGNNGVATIRFHRQGLKYLLMLVTAVSAGDNVRAFFTGY
jgi:hypothetical protein